MQLICASLIFAANVMWCYMGLLHHPQMTFAAKRLKVLSVKKLDNHCIYILTLKSPETRIIQCNTVVWSLNDEQHVRFAQLNIKHALVFLASNPAPTMTSPKLIIPIYESHIRGEVLSDFAF